jgi:hypothetical protein
MWGTVLVLALLAAADPARLGATLLLISRPRPLHSLLGYWLGGMVASMAGGLAALILLRDSVPMVMQDVTSRVASFTGGYIQIAIGVLALLISALISVGLPARQHAGVPVHADVPSAPVLQPTTPTAFSRLTARVHHALEDGCPWIAFVAGLGSAIPPVEYLVVLTTILTSGAAIGTQFSAVVMFTIVVLALFEVSLISYLTMPTKTQAAVVLLQNWVRAHGRQIFAAIVAVAGVFLVATGMGST